MTSSMLSLLAPLLLAGAPDDAVTFSAVIQAEELKRGGKYHITVDVTFAEGLSPADAGVPAPILQVDVPSCARLSGKEVKTLRQLSANDFLQEPYERLVTKDRTRVRFRLTDAPTQSDRFFLNLLAYVSGPDGPRFVRRRLEVPVMPKSTGTPVAPSSSSWGTEELVQIGEEAPDFSLPKSDGSTVTLSQFRGKKNVLVTTYRAHW